MDHSLTMRTSWDGPDAVVHLSGEADLSDQVALRSFFAALLAQSPRTLTLDLGYLNFLDSTSMGELIRLQRTLSRLGQKLTVRRPNAHVRKLLTLMGLGLVLNIEDDIEASNA